MFLRDNSRLGPEWVVNLSNTFIRAYIRYRGHKGFRSKRKPRRSGAEFERQ